MDQARAPRRPSRLVLPQGDGRACAALPASGARLGLCLPGSGMGHLVLVGQRDLRDRAPLPLVCLDALEEDDGEEESPTVGEAAALRRGGRLLGVRLAVPVGGERQNTRAQGVLHVPPPAHADRGQHVPAPGSRGDGHRPGANGRGLSEDGAPSERDVTPLQAGGPLRARSRHPHHRAD